MLRLAYGVHELDFSALMNIYQEGNQENAEERYPNLTAEEGLCRAEQDFYDYLKHDFFRTQGAFYALWEVQGVPVSALRMEPYRDGYLLEALETAPKYRRRGHAKKLMQAFLNFVKQNDLLPVYSHIRKGNLPSERVHSTCGFAVYRDLAAYIDGSVDYRCNTWKYM